MELLKHMIIQCLTFSGTTILFSTNFNLPNDHSPGNLAHCNLRTSPVSSVEDLRLPLPTGLLPQSAVESGVTKLLIYKHGKSSTGLSPQRPRSMRWAGCSQERWGCSVALLAPHSPGLSPNTASAETLAGPSHPLALLSARNKLRWSVSLFILLHFQIDKREGRNLICLNHSTALASRTMPGTF